MNLRSSAILLRNELNHQTGVPLEQICVVRSPYRVCPLGAHIDHQGGVVTAMAIDQSVLLAFAPSVDRRVTLTSSEFPGSVEFDLDAIPPKGAGDWGNYARGAVRALERVGARLQRGMIARTAGRLHGGGVSSSAAIGVAYLLAFESINDGVLAPETNIQLAQSIENDYLGLRTGILDQAAILLSRRGELTRIDCQSLRHERIPLSSQSRPFRILLAFSGFTGSLVGTDYNRRVAECAEAARTLLEACGRANDQALLRNVAPHEYAEFGHRLTGPPARRAAHFFSEMERVEQGVDAWQRGDLASFGHLMTESGASSIHQYECGSPPLIALYNHLVHTDGVLGARFSGAGFRGCCVALVDSDAAELVAERVKALYAASHPELAAHAPILICDSDDGAEIIEPDDPRWND